MNPEQEKDPNVHVNVKKDNGCKIYRYTCKTDKNFISGASYMQNDCLADDILRSLADVPANSQVTLSSAHKLMSDTHTHEAFLTAEELRDLADKIEKSRKDLKIVLKPVGIIYFKDIDSPIGA